MQNRNPNNAQGIDISHWQGVVNWEKVKAAGISFAIMKSTEGWTMIDDTLQANVEGARAFGIAVGVYHFCRASNVTEAIQEAQFFASVLDSVGGVEALDIPPALDIETVHAATKEEITAICHAWLEYIEARYKVTPMIYSYPWFTSKYLDTSLSEYPLWMADYDGNPPLDRSGWTEWTFLQYTDKGNVPGIYGNVDMNEFNGGLDKLFAKKLNAEDSRKISTAAQQHQYLTDQYNADPVGQEYLKEPLLYLYNVMKERGLFYGSE